jgi:hypothetical protein
MFAPNPYETASYGLNEHVANRFFAMQHAIVTHVPVGVKSGNTHREWMFSAFPPIANTTFWPGPGIGCLITPAI